MTRNSSSPIHVFVSETRWDAFGADSFSYNFILVILKFISVSNTVPPGEYTSNVIVSKALGFIPNNK